MEESNFMLRNKVHIWWHIGTTRCSLGIRSLLGIKSLFYNTFLSLKVFLLQFRLLEEPGPNIYLFMKTGKEFYSV
jgi:hypothetical protein